MYRFFFTISAVLLLITTSTFGQDQTDMAVSGTRNEYSNQGGSGILIIYSEDIELERVREFSSGFTSYLSNKNIDCRVRTRRTDRPVSLSWEEKHTKLSMIFSNKLLMDNTDVIITPDRESYELVASLDSLIPCRIRIISLITGTVDDPISNRYSVISTLYPFEQNLRLGRDLFPLAKKVFLIFDDTEFGRAESQQAMAAIKGHEKNLNVNYLLINPNNCDSIVKNLNSFEGRAFVILSSWSLDKKGNYICDEKITPFLSQINIPVLGIQNLSMGSGVLGGYQYSVWDAGYHTGFRTAKVLENPLLCYREKLDKSRLVLDYNVVRRFNLKKDFIPSDAEYINNQKSIFDSYSSEINFIISLIVLLSSSLVIFALYHFRYIRISKNNLKLQKENEERKEVLNNTLSVMSEGVISFDSNLRIIDINSAAMQLSGSSGNFMGKGFDEVFSTSQPKGQDSVVAILERVLRNKRRLQIPGTTRINYTNRESRIINGSISPVVNSDGTVSQLVFVFYDTSDSFKQTRFLNLALESARAYTWYYNTFSNRFLFDDHYKIFAGEENLQEVSMSFFIKSIHPEDREKFLLCHQNILEKKTTVFMVEYRIRFNNKQNYEWWERRGISVRDNSADEENVYVYGMDINIAGHKERELELINARNKAEESDRLKSAFLSNMSHEIRTPLNGIVGFSNLLTDNDYTPEEKSNFIRIINENSKILMSLISDILDLSRIESDSMSFNFRPVNLSQQFKEILDSYKIYSKENLRIETVLPQIPAVVIVDQNRNRQIITNLLNNSLKFTESGHIKFGYFVKDDYVEVFVEDTGRGIEKDRLNSIFDRFYKIDDFVSGTGLGLSICKAIVEHLGGKIWVDSALGKGTTVRYTIKNTNK